MTRSSRAPRPRTPAVVGLLLLGLALVAQMAPAAPTADHCVVKMPCCAGGYCPLEGHHRAGQHDAGLRLVRCDDGSRAATAPVPLPPIVLASSAAHAMPALATPLATATVATAGALRPAPETPPPKRAAGDPVSLLPIT